LAYKQEDNSMIAYVPAIIVLSLAAGLLAADSYGRKIWETRNLGSRERHPSEIDTIDISTDMSSALFAGTLFGVAPHIRELGKRNSQFVHQADREVFSRIQWALVPFVMLLALTVQGAA
jgi:hypothetical protein